MGIFLASMAETARYGVKEEQEKDFLKMIFVEKRGMKII